MKKIVYSVDIFLLLASLISFVGYASSCAPWLGTLLSCLIIAFGGVNVFYAFTKKNKGVRVSAILIVAGILIATISNIFIVKNVNLFYSLMFVSTICYIVALVLKAKFSFWEIGYVLAIAIPVVLMVNLAPLFGFMGVFNRVVVSLFMTASAGLLGLSISHLNKKQNAFNIMFVVLSFLGLIYGFGLTILTQSNVTHKITPIVDLCFYLIILLFSASIFFIDTTKSATIKTKKHITNVVNLTLVTILIAYTIVSNFMAFNFVSAKISKGKFMDMVGGDLNIPIVEIYTQDKQQPYSKEEYVNCSFEISNCEDEEFNFSVPMADNYEDEGCVGIRLRGNSTKDLRKRPYRIKFDEKQSLFGLKKNKSWVLLADFLDQSYIRNFTAFTLADKFDNLDFSPTPHHVALVINDEFKGLYLLCEQMDEKKGRANVDDDFDVATDTDFPFFVEMDANAFKEGKTGVDNFYVPSANNYVEIKFPEADERGATKESDLVYDYIYEYINAVFTAMKTNDKISFRGNLVGLSDLVDIDSMVDYYLVNEIMHNTDVPYKSIYMHKSKDGKLKFGPVWDFDFSMASKWDLPYSQSYIEDANNLWVAKMSRIYKYMFQNEEFYNKVQTRFNEKKSAILETCNEMKVYKEMIDEVAKIDAKMWHGTTGAFQFDTQYDYVRLFLMDRYDYLSSVFAGSYSEFINLIA